jgi:Kelch motif protein
MQCATKIFRVSLQTGFLFLLIFGTSGSATIATGQSSGTFARTGNMTTARSQHTATQLPNGKVLIAGGVQSTSLSGAPLILAVTELYDPGTGTFNPAGNMTTARRMHTSTLLADGRVLIAGGYGAEGAVASAELYDPSTGSFTATGDMITARGGHTAILLANGKVLMVGGYGTAAGYPMVAAAELYDAPSGTFTAGGAYVGRGGCDFCAPAILLPDGRVLFPGQYPAQLYDPITNAFSVDGMMISDHSAATLLTNGKVLFAGGEDFGRSSTAELYDPATGAFASTGNMAWRRVWHTLTLLPNGMVLTTGGETDSCGANFCMFAGSVASAERYDPSAGIFIPTSDMAAPRETHTATLLNDGRVLIAGGVSYGGIGIFGGSLPSAELYNPDVLVPAPALVSLSGNGQGQGAIFHARTSHAVAPNDPAAAGEIVDIQCTGLGNESVIPPQVAIGGRMAEVLMFGKAPGLPGVNRVTVRVPSGITPGAAVPVRLTYIGRPSNEVTIAVQP